MYLLEREIGFPTQSALMTYILDGLLRIHFQDDQDCARIQASMTAYRDLPMDLADASLVAAAETLGLRCVFTLDRHFYAHRLADGSAMEFL